ncbi:MAG: prepilin-type N-terminal cleavage/methylation domain-containing protein [Planctomycetota bacterium]
MGVRRKGFTLIELLVVIAIIALLMSILMPALRNVRDQAKNSMCMQRLQQWGVMYNMYASEYDGKLMGWAEYAWYGGEFVEHAWVPMMYDYAKSFDMYLCPSATRLWGYGEGWGKPDSAWDFQFIVQGEPSAGEWFPYYMVGTPPNQVYSYGSYGKNEFVADGEPWGDEPEGSPWHFKTIRARGIANIPLQGDASWAAGFPTIYDEPSDIREHQPICGCGGEINRWNMDRHNMSVNFVFLDWSVRKVGNRQLWSLTWTRQKAPDGSPGWGNMSIVPDWTDITIWPEWMQIAKNYDL